MRIHILLDPSEYEVIESTFKVYEYIVGRVVNYPHPKTGFMIYSTYPDESYYGVKTEKSIIQFCNDTSKIQAPLLCVRHTFCGIIIGEYRSCIHGGAVEYALAVSEPHNVGIICRVRSTVNG